MIWFFIPQLIASITVPFRVCKLFDPKNAGKTDIYGVLVLRTIPLFYFYRPVYTH